MKIFLFAVGAALTAAGVYAASDYPVRPADLTNVSITAGFWLPRFETNRIVTVRTDFKKSEETGRINNFVSAGKRETGTFKGIPFDDSDVYKIIEGASYTLATHPDPKLDAYLDNLIANIAKAQEPDGYLYTARTLGFRNGMTGPTRWSACGGSHELYNIGHMYEAAAAHYAVTGKKTLLNVAIKSADLIERTFGTEQSQLRIVPGHEEIEVGLCKLYRVTGDVRYLNLAKRFLDMRGRSDLRPLWGANVQDHLPVLEQKEAVGHAVRAGYLYAGMADVAALSGDAGYRHAIDDLWENVVGRKLHLNGGIGAYRHATHPKWGHADEAFAAEYDLPNEGAYLETCAAIANALWNQRMFLFHGDAKYIDVLERILYNGFLSGIALSGDAFFYPNPLASKGGYARSKWFGCSCCPVNIVRFIPQIASFAYATRDDVLYWNLFIAGAARLPLTGGLVRVNQKTDYPWKGSSVLTVTPAADGQHFTLRVRVPGWAVGRPVPSDLYTQVVPGSLKDVSVAVNGAPFPFVPEKGYCVIDRKWKTGDTVEIRMNMPVRRIQAHRAVIQDRGRLAVECGPVVYCAEGVDNGGRVFNASIAPDASFSATTCDILGNIFPAFEVPSAARVRGVKLSTEKRSTLKLIPYFAWCHRGTGEMQTWFPVDPAATEASSLMKASASRCYEADTPAALSDDILPASSSDEKIRRFTFWPAKGTEEWVQYDLPAPEPILGTEVYWFEDAPRGACRLPASWRIQVRTDAGADWQDVSAVCPIVKDGFSSVTFSKPVTASSVRLLIRLKKNFSAGLLEWRLK